MNKDATERLIEDLEDAEFAYSVAKGWEMQRCKNRRDGARKAILDALMAEGQQNPNPPTPE